MSEAFGSDYLTIEDEDGNEFELEVLDEFELDGQSYLAALPADMDEDDPDFGIVLLKIIEETVRSSSAPSTTMTSWTRCMIIICRKSSPTRTRMRRRTRRNNFLHSA